MHGVGFMAGLGVAFGVVLVWVSLTRDGSFVTGCSAGVVRRFGGVAFGGGFMSCFCCIVSCGGVSGFAGCAWC